MTAVISDTQAEQARNALAYQHLIDPQLWGRLTRRISREERVGLPLAERIMNEALGFLQLCALDPDHGFSPSTLVDIGWHTFILYTREYGAFCHNLAGRMIHHQPADIPGVEYGAMNPNDTFEALVGRGFDVDATLWDPSCTLPDGDDEFRALLDRHGLVATGNCEDKSRCQTKCTYGCDGEVSSSCSGTGFESATQTWVPA